MLFSVATAATLVSAAAAAAVPRASGNFKVHARCVGRTDFQDSPGYLYAEYAYPPGYYAALDTNPDNGIVGYTSDPTNPSNSSLIFPESGGYYQGFVLYPLTQQYPESIAQIFSGQTGTKGIYVDENGLVQWQAQDGVPIVWEACPNTPLEYGTATALKYRWSNTTTSSGCWDAELVAEYQ
ncbi:hypothetical protein K431DRAFT_282591 [Polychaeton citri CBS 116435]|uniref:DUF7907 domain-containing protein n=1 Tax=Polychaeton citri CBS 116435 TaxID=1314669 RepID=A0A9P4URG9_9PEZI|nr:hypothetical protein K431DRAFT_282591 [Polychaeton citri CBS 116435]